EKTLKIITLAPEVLARDELEELVAWARKRKVLLSIGHTRATEAQARQAFDLGFGAVTHAWNAMTFHQREPGTLGAALGREDVSVELIVDQVHVSAKVVEWTRRLHPA